MPAGTPNDLASADGFTAVKKEAPATGAGEETERPAARIMEPARVRDPDDLEAVQRDVARLEWELVAARESVRRVDDEVAEHERDLGDTRGVLEKLREMPASGLGTIGVFGAFIAMGWFGEWIATGLHEGGWSKFVTICVLVTLGVAWDSRNRLKKDRERLAEVMDLAERLRDAEQARADVQVRVSLDEDEAASVEVSAGTAEERRTK